MYLPKSKYKPAKYTRGDKFSLQDNTPYVGWYFETYDGKIFSGDKPNKNSVQLIDTSYTSESTDKKFKSDIIAPTEVDYINGYFTRYFVQDKRNNAVIETNNNNYRYYLRKNHVRTVQVKWLLTTPVENVNKGPYIYFGSEAKNKESIMEAEKTIFGVSILIKSYSEFVRK